MKDIEVDHIVGKVDDSSLGVDTRDVDDDDDRSLGFS